MGKRTKKRGVKAYIAIVCLVLLLAAGALASGYRDRQLREQETLPEEWVELAEIKEELSFGVYGQEDWNSFFETFSGDRLTGEILGELLAKLQLSDYIEIPVMRESQKVSREDWNYVYGQILDLLDMEYAVTKTEFLVVDVMEAENQNVIMTNKGDFCTVLPASYFKQWNGYEGYCVENRCIGVAGTLKKEFTLDNTYLTDCTKDSVDFLYAGAVYHKETASLTEGVSPCVCDIVLADGRITALRVKQETIEGELLSYDDETIEIKEYGKLSHTGKLPVYQTYGEVSEKSISDVTLGNMNVEYVTGEKQVCAILIREPAVIREIRVLLLADDGTKCRQSVYLKCTTDAAVTWQGETTQVAAQTLIAASDRMAGDAQGTFTVTPEQEGCVVVCDANGAELSNGYGGSMEVRALGDGYTLVNSLPLERYLQDVVPSEMPASYEPEALKAQAVCARSYACIQLLRGDLAEYGAHIDDSTAYQVYNRVTDVEAAREAVLATQGEVLSYEGNIVEAYYFSTSMGYTAAADVWNVEEPEQYGYLAPACLLADGKMQDLSGEEAFLSYIQNPAEGYDSDCRYFRWRAEADCHGKTDEVNAILLERRNSSPRNVTFYQTNQTAEIQNPDASSVAALGEVTGMSAAERGSSGALLALKITYEKGSALVRTEYNIRKVLGACAGNLVCADGTEQTDVTMLPSAFLTITKQEDGGMVLYGGGYGHGLGMSQNAANGMAKAGMNYEEILQYFYNDVKLERNTES